MLWKSNELLEITRYFWSLFCECEFAVSEKRIDSGKLSKETVPSQHLVLDIDDNLTASREMRVRRRRLFELRETSWSALLIQHLLLLKALHFQPCFVPLIVHPRENQHVQNQQATSDRDCHAQGCRVRGVTVNERIYNKFSFLQFDQIAFKTLIIFSLTNKIISVSLLSLEIWTNFVNKS